MSWPGFLPPGPGAPAAVTPLRDVILGALAEAFITRRDGVSRAVFCAGCTPGRLCDDHAGDLAAADVYEAAYMRVAGIGSDGAVLELTGGLT